MTNDYSIIKDTLKNLSNLQNQAQTKYTYYLLSVSAAAIAFAVHKTSGSALSWTQIPLGSAVFFWCLSFYYGCKTAQYDIEFININWKLVSLSDPDFSDLPKTADSFQHGKDLLDTKGRDIDRSKKYQFGFIIAGALMFIFWHIIEMYILL